MVFPWFLVLLAWGTLFWAFSTQRAVFFDHDYLLRVSHLPWLIAMLVFLLGWPLMTVAMMLPSTFSMLSQLVVSFQQARWGHVRSIILLSSFIVAYISVWMLFAALAFVGDTLVHWLVKHWWWLYIHSWLIGSVTLTVAGVFQLSTFKRRCLHHCRAVTDVCPHASQYGLKEIWQQGLRYGLWCLGSCWAIMLLMFGLGLKSLLTIVTLTAMIFLEKEVPGGARLRPLIGILLLVLAWLWFLARST
jgi:predicted metal-binding membrane protein